ATRAHVELARPLDLRFAGAKVRLKTPEDAELALSSTDTDKTVRNKQAAMLTFEVFPRAVEFTWKPQRPEFAVSGVADLWVFGRVAEVKQNLQFATPERLPGSSKNEPVRLRVPSSVRDLVVVSGGKLNALDMGRQTAWLTPAADAGVRADVILR